MSPVRMCLVGINDPESYKTPAQPLCMWTHKPSLAPSQPNDLTPFPVLLYESPSLRFKPYSRLYGGFLLFHPPKCLARGSPDCFSPDLETSFSLVLGDPPHQSGGLFWGRGVTKESNAGKSKVNSQVEWEKAKGSCVKNSPKDPGKDHALIYEPSPTDLRVALSRVALCGWLIIRVFNRGKAGSKQPDSGVPFPSLLSSSRSWANKTPAGGELPPGKAFCRVGPYFRRCC